MCEACSIITPPNYKAVEVTYRGLRPGENIIQIPLDAPQLNGLTPLSQFFGPIFTKLAKQAPAHLTWWIAGGSVTRWLEGANVNYGDVDIFTANKRARMALIEGLDRSMAGSERPVASPFALSFSYGNTRLQIVRRFSYPSIMETLRSFDFTARMAGIDGRYLYVGETTREDIRQRKLVAHPHDGVRPMGTLTALTKYAHRGYTMDWEEARRFMKDWDAQNVEPEFEERY